MEKLSAAQVSSLYGVSMAEYGGEGGASPMMALMTHPQHGAQAQGVDGNIITIVPGAFSSFNGQPECLVSATPKATATAMFHADKFQQLIPADQAAAARSVSSAPFVKTEGFPNLGSCFEFHAAQARNCFAELSPGLIGLHPTEADSSHFSINRIAAVTNHEQEAADAMKAKISAHPQYPCLLNAYLDCQKVGAPAEVVARLDAVSEEYEKGRNGITMNIGMDPELDRFMEAYCEMLLKYHEELTKPFKEAMTFFKKIETQLNSLSKGTIRISPSAAENDEKAEGGRSSDEGDCSTGETDYQEVDHHPEERELKDRLLRKYSGYLGSLKQEFMKKKKKGKLPKDARQKLLDWWTVHYKWPYPSETEKVALAELTGLDQKQINNWFINQRKRHWKPSEDMQFVVMDGHTPHDGAYFVERHLMAEGSAFHFDC